MFLQGIKLLNFKNYEQCHHRFGEKLTLIHGVNGSGKTNLLDAIYYACLSKSYFGMTDKQIVKHDAAFFRIEADFSDEDKTALNINYKYRLNQKKEIEIDKVKLNSPVELMGQLPIVFIAPDDAKIVKEGSLERRDFMNRILCQVDPTYLRTLINYRSLLKQKEAILKNDRHPDTTVLDSFNVRMAPLAHIIFVKRKEFVTQLAKKTNENYETIAEANERVSISYVSQLLHDSIDNLLQVRQYDEIMARRTVVGTHKDDLIFEIDARPLKKYGSQGQIKSFLYALRLAEFDILKMALGKLPILMFDDYFEKLDGHRLNSLLSIIADQTYGQIFLSDTELDRSKQIFDNLGVLFHALEISCRK